MYSKILIELTLTVSIRILLFSIVVIVHNFLFIIIIRDRFFFLSTLLKSKQSIGDIERKQALR